MVPEFTDRTMKHWSPETDPCINGYLIYDKGIMVTQKQKTFFPSINVLSQLDINRENLNPDPYISQKSVPVIIDQNVNGKRAKLLEDHKIEYLQDRSVRNLKRHVSTNHRGQD